MAEVELSGKRLNELWGVGARHALYREDGKWYHQLQTFPGALFDANGFIVLRTENEYKNSPHFQIKKDLHVPNGISSIPGYTRVSEKSQMMAFSQKVIESFAYKAQSQVTIAPENVSQSSILAVIDLQGTERTEQRVDRIIRDTKLSQNIKILYAYKCQICATSIVIRDGITFYIEAHHIKPLGSPHKGPDVLENVICVCPNHHVQLDYGAIKLRKTELYLIDSHKINEEYIEYHNKIIFKNY